MSGTAERAGAIALVGIRAALEREDLTADRRRAAEIYLLVTGCALPGAVAARVVGCSKQNISKALRKAEGRRDDPGFDAVLRRLERRLFGEE